MRLKFEIPKLTPKNFVLFLRWCGRIYGAYLAGFLAVYEIAPKLGDFFSRPFFERMTIVALIAVSMGYILGWFKERVAAHIILWSWFVFWTFNWFVLNGVIAVLPVPGVIYLFSWRMWEELKERGEL